MSVDSDWFFPRGELADERWETCVDQRIPGWQYTGLLVGGASDGRPFELAAAPVERMIIPLDALHVSIDFDSERSSGLFTLGGRASVFAGPADVAYLGVGTRATITTDGRFAVASAPATEWVEPAIIRAPRVPVELRGAGQASREVHNFGVPGVLDAERLIVCEVITPDGNWSSYPPHKHDTLVPGVESQLEEIYYFECAAAGAAAETAGGGDPFGLFAAYSSPGHTIELDARVHTGDVALVPHGYHGPAVAAPGYDLYYLNVMAGPGAERVWNITTDPAHDWIRNTWAAQDVDPRLPLHQRKSGR